MHGPRVKHWRAPLTFEARERIRALLEPTPLRDFAAAVNQAHDSTGAERKRCASVINSLLLTGSSNRNEWGAAVAERIDLLDGLVDPRGTSCRDRAVEALLELGWPWALHVTPEDLDRRKAGYPTAPSLLPWLGAAAFTVVMLCLFFVGYFSAR